jgi:probable rRNA maturation factor
LSVERLPVHITATRSTYRSHEAYLRRHLQAAHALLRPALKELSLALVGDRKMAALHQQFLGIPGPTDVLTFPLELDKKKRPITGEVVICVPEARRQYRQRRPDVTMLRKELLLYALHGMLHLCGFDDRTESDFHQMHQREDEILSQLGVGTVFKAG